MTLVNELPVDFSGNTVLLSGHKSIFDPVTKALYIADLHAGKAATLRMHGVPVTEEILREDLERLALLAQYYAPSELVVLGDFFHAKAGKLPEVFEILSIFRASLHDLPITIVEGNHDRWSGLMPSHLKLSLVEEGTPRGAFHLYHYPQERTDQKIVCGHLHPAIKVPSIGKIPCFIYTENQIIVPSFGSTTAGACQSRDGKAVYYLVTPEQEIFKF